MWTLLFAGAAVSLVNFAIHGVITGLIVVATRHAAHRTGDRGLFIRISSLMTITMVALMFAHMAEIAVWAGYYTWAGVEVKGTGLFEMAFENYTALGYGDAVPSGGFRLLGPITSLNGLLLIGWSVAIIFEVMRMAELKFGVRR